MRDSRVEWKLTWNARFERLEQPVFTSGIGLKVLGIFHPTGFISVPWTDFRELFPALLLGLLFVWLDLTSWVVLQDDLHWHVSKCFANVTSISQLIVDFSQMDSYYFHVVPSLKYQGQNDFSLTPANTLEHQKASLVCSPWRPTMGLVVPFIELVIVGVILIQWQYQSLCPATGFGLWLSSVNFELVVLAMWSNWSVLTIIFTSQRSCSFPQEQDPTLFKCSYGHVPTNPGDCYWSFSVQPPYRDCLCSVYRKPVLSSCNSCRQFVWKPWLCLNMRCSVLRLCPCRSHPYSTLMTLSLRTPDCQHSLSFHPQSCLPDWWWPSWTGGRTDRFLPILLKLVPVPSIHSGMFSPPCVELCSLLALTSWESTWVLFCDDFKWTAGNAVLLILCGNG